MRLLFLSLILITFSCTIQKRIHRPGFHISSKKHTYTKSSNETKHSSKESRNWVSVSPLHVQKNKATTRNNTEPKKEFKTEKRDTISTSDQMDLAIKEPKINSITTSKIKKEGKSIILVKDDPEEEEPEKKREWMAIVGNILGILSLAMAGGTVVYIVLGYIFSFAGWYAVGFVPTIITFALLSNLFGKLSNSPRFQSIYATIAIGVALISLGALVLLLLLF